MSIRNDGHYFPRTGGIPIDGLNEPFTLSQELADDLGKTGVTFVTQKRRNMKAQLLAEWDKIMLSRRFIIETIHGQLKTVSQIEHSRHRSIKGFMLTVLGGLIAYCLKWKKPSLKVFYSEDDFSVTA